MENQNATKAPGKGKSKKLWGSKDKIVLEKGIFGDALDYRWYQMSFQETVVGALMGFGFIFLVVFAFFASGLVALLLGLGGIVPGIYVYRKYLTKKRNKEFTFQFKDMLEALSNSYGVGRNTPDAFADAAGDLSSQYGVNSLIAQELRTIMAGLSNNYTIETMLNDLALRSGSEDVASFAATFEICNRMGGNLRDTVSEAQQIIGDKIEIEADIAASIAQKKNELNILACMPVLIVLMLRFTGNETLVSNSLTNIVVKVIAIVFFGIAYVVGRRLTQIKI